MQRKNHIKTKKKKKKTYRNTHTSHIRCFTCVGIWVWKIFSFYGNFFSVRHVGKKFNPTFSFGWDFIFFFSYSLHWISSFCSKLHIMSILSNFLVSSTNVKIMQWRLSIFSLLNYSKWHSHTTRVTSIKWDDPTMFRVTIKLHGDKKNDFFLSSLPYSKLIVCRLKFNILSIGEWNGMENEMIRQKMRIKLYVLARRERAISNQIAAFTLVKMWRSFMAYHINQTNLLDFSRCITVWESCSSKRNKWK